LGATKVAKGHPVHALWQGQKTWCLPTGSVLPPALVGYYRMLTLSLLLKGQGEGQVEPRVTCGELRRGRATVIPAP